MKEIDFIDKYSSQWENLKVLTSKIESKGINKLPSSDIKEFLHLFRLCSRHLAYARTHFPGSRVIDSLNSLLGRSHNLTYGVKKFSSKGILEYIYSGFPKLIKDNRLFIIISTGIFFAGIIFSLIFTMVNTQNAYYFLPSNIIENIKNATDTGFREWDYPLISSEIMINNITVSLNAFVLGITLGIGTVYILFYNGLILGSLTALVYMHGNPFIYWSLILPHGIIELCAIFISGAAGLIVGYSMLVPGQYSRRHSIVSGAKRAVSLVFGIIHMLVIAAIIEGFFTPINISPAIKLLFAFMTAVLLWGYFAIPYLRRKKLT